MQASFLALGDSYTIGEGVDTTATWPAQLVAALRETGHAVGDPEIIATTGWTTYQLVAAIDARALNPPYALITLLIGVNNQYRGLDLANYREEFANLLDRAIVLAGGQAGHVIVISIPDWSVTPFAELHGVDRARIARAIDDFNDVAREIASARAAAWVNVTGISRGAGRALLADDGLHPSAAQYALWSMAILPRARARLRQAT